MTRNGIEYNFRISPYTCQIDNVLFTFSSRMYLRKFKENRETFHRDMSRKLAKFNIKQTNNLLSDILYYSHIEKRGFRIMFTDSGDIYTSLEDIWFLPVMEENKNGREAEIECPFD